MRGRVAVFLGALVGGLLTSVATSVLVAPGASGDPVVVQSGLGVRQLVGGLRVPTSARVAADGRIFVANKRGDIWAFDGPGDTTQTVTADLKIETHSAGDRGLLGIELDPGFTTGRPYLYALYMYNKDPFGSATVPRWTINGTDDQCPNPPTLHTDGCTATARLVRLTVGADGVAPPSSQKILLDGASDPLGGWCFQFPSHGIGTVAFGPDGGLYVGAGDGAGFSSVDYGQYGGTLAGTPTPVNPCNDGPDGRGTMPQRETSSGGALRAQSVRAATANGYVPWNGAILRVDPETGGALPTNPLVGNGRAGDDRIVAYGMRNPFRFGFRPGTDEMWIGDVGWARSEEINIARTGPTQNSVPNFGWPCHEGGLPQPSYDAANLGLCESLYTSPMSSLGGVPSPVTSPHLAWSHDDEPLPAASCGAGGGGAATGGQFVTSSSWPASVRGAYVFADYVRGCLVAMRTDAGGDPDPSNVVPLVTNTYPVDIQRDAQGNLYWVDIVTESVMQLYVIGGNQQPVASFSASPAAGPLPLAVQFDGSASHDPDPDDTLTHTWDLDGDGSCDDATGVTTQRTYTDAGSVDVKLCVTDQAGATGTSTVTITPGESAPVISSATASHNVNGWGVGDHIGFSALATTGSGGSLPNSAYAWTFDVRHCATESETTCHTHPLSEASGRQTGLTGPEHDYYAYIRATVTVTGPNGLTASRTFDVRPRVSTVTLKTAPAGINVTNGLNSGVSPVVSKYLHRGIVQLAVPQTAVLNGKTYRFSHWKDGSTAGPEREFPAPAGNMTRVAQYVVSDTAPQVTSISVSPTNVPSRPADVAFTALAADDIGVTWARARLVAPNGKAYSRDLSLTGGSATSGTWTGTVRLPSSAPTGRYTTRVMVRDTAGVQRGVNGPDVQVN